MSNIYNNFSKALVSKLINQATQNITSKQSPTKYEHFTKQSQKGKHILCVGTSHAFNSETKNIALKKHVEETFKNATFDIVLTEGGKGPFNYFNETLLEKPLNPQQSTTHSNSTMRQELFCCEMNYMRQLAAQKNKLAFCIEPSHTDEKESFKRLLTTNLNDLIADKTIQQETTQVLHSLNMNNSDLVTAFYIVRSFEKVLTELNKKKQIQSSPKLRFDLEDIETELCKNSKLFTQEEVQSSIKLISLLVPTIKEDISCNNTNWLAAPAQALQGKKKPSVFNYLNQILNKEVREPHWLEVINKLQDYNILIFVGNGHIKQLSQKI
tara:strand:+ start:189 stop:1163 length:975 start_codon:yes stop_codon:yes gene_type:complete